MRPIEVLLPSGSLLNPCGDAAVVGELLCRKHSINPKLIIGLGGNVLTSQRLVDVILRAFGACAASQVLDSFVSMTW